MTTTSPVATASSTLTLLAPLSGVIVSLDDVPDEAFSQRLAGDGASIDPTSDRLVAPCDGEVRQVHRAGHAVTLDAAGLEIIIHIGLDTVNLKGEGFAPAVKAGDRVRAGDALIRFDGDFVARSARSLLTQIVIANMERVAGLRLHKGRAPARVAVVSGSASSITSISTSRPRSRRSRARSRSTSPAATRRPRARSPARPSRPP